MSMINASVASSASSFSIEDIMARAIRKPAVPIMLEGDPGCGKTARILAFAKKHGLYCYHLSMSTADINEVGGVLYRDGSESFKTTPGWVKKFIQEGKGILLLDEFNTAHRCIQDTFLNIIQSRTVGDGTKIPDGVVIVAIQNPSVQCGNYRMNPAMRNRFATFPMRNTTSEFLSFLKHEIEEEDEAIIPYEEPELSHQNMENFRDYIWTANKRLAEGLNITKKMFNLLEKIALLSITLKSEDLLTTGDGWMEDGLCTSNRSITNLLYWANTPKDMVTLAPYFTDRKFSEKIADQYESYRSANTAANAVFGANREKVDVNKEESELAEEKGEFFKNHPSNKKTKKTKKSSASSTES